MNIDPECLSAEIYDLVREIPAGRVATYGMVARLAGIPSYARWVGRASIILLHTWPGLPEKSFETIPVIPGDSFVKTHLLVPDRPVIPGISP